MNIYPDEELDGTNEGLDITGNNPPEGGAVADSQSTSDHQTENVTNTPDATEPEGVGQSGADNELANGNGQE